MNMANRRFDRVKLGLGIALLVISAGCIVPVGGGYDGGEVVVPGPPDVLLFGGGYERGRDVHAYSQRGFASRAAAHPEVRRAQASHAGGGGEAKKR
jgi:hypothetical protein